MKCCPICDQTILAKESKCRHCQYDLTINLDPSILAAARKEQQRLAAEGQSQKKAAISGAWFSSEITAAPERNKSLLDMSNQTSEQTSHENEAPESVSKSKLEEKQCPYCCETIKIKAIKCKHCGSDISAREIRLTNKIAQSSADPKRLHPNSVDNFDLRNLSEKDLRAFEFEFNQRRKNIGVAYCLLILVGMLGGHHFYLEDSKRGITYAALFIGGWLLSIIWIGCLALLVLGCLFLYDCFKLPKKVQELNYEIRNSVISKLLA
jgi:TM2 domain-containing membrane protein YozV